MLYKNEIIKLKSKYLTKNSLTTKLSLYYGIILIVILGIALSMGVVGVLFYLKLGINDIEEFVEILIKTSMAAFCLGVFLIVVISPILSKKILEPLDKITKAEQEISVEKLDKRINYTGNEIELKMLSDSFDKMIERLEISFKKQNQFISDVSHELKTPISVISGYTNLLDRWGKNDEETCNKSIQAIKNETKNMNILVSKLLYIAKADTGEVKLNKSKINVKELINEIVEETHLIEPDKKIYSSCNETCYIKADMHNIKELIRIFIDNSIKYTSQNGEIDIFSEIKNSEIYISVKDNGIGIEKEEQECIFDRFYRVDKSRNKETGGVGLGLAIAKTIAEMNNAKITLKSEPGKGSTFTLIFEEYTEEE